MRFVRRARAVADPQHVRGADIGLAVGFVDAGERRLVTQQQRLVRGEETRFGKLFHVIERQAAGFHEA